MENLIKGLTLIRPWPFAILMLGKRIENRSWKPNLNVGDWIAIHAGAKWDKSDAEWISRRFRIVPSKEAHPTGVIVGVARYQGYTSYSPDPWFFGPYGWLLSNVQAITPIPHKGALGLWELQPSALEQVTAIVAKSCF